MKRLLSVVAILVLAASLFPAKGHAIYRGAYAPISSGDNLIRGKFSPVLRPVPTGGAGSATSPRRERWIAFVTLSSVVGNESTGEIWLYRNVDRACDANGICPLPVLRDESAAISYIDPAWSRDGKWLMYVQTDNAVSQSSIYIQQFDTSTATDGTVPLGSPILVADGSGGVHHRHPVFNSNATQVAYDSDAFGPSIDLWTVNISLDPVAHTGTVDGSSRTRHQLGLEGDPASQAILNGKAEFKPAYRPDNSQIAYVTNRYGTFQIQLLTQTANGLGETVVGAEQNPASITHDNPSWAPDGNTLYYDAASNEDPANPQDIWKLDITNGSKCNMFVDLAGDVDPDVSKYTNPTLDGATFNFFAFISQAGGLGQQIWLGEAIQQCKPALPMIVGITPGQMDVSPPKSEADSLRHFGDEIVAHLTFPAQTINAGYVCRAANQPNNFDTTFPTKEGVRMRRSFIASPTMMGLVDRGNPASGDCTNMDMSALLSLAPGETVSCFDVLYYIFGSIGRYQCNINYSDGLNHEMDVHWRQQPIAARIVALGLVDRYVGLEVRAYSNRVGQQFIGFGYIRVSQKNLAGSAIVLEQNSPNPFNPITKVNFAVSKPGNVEVRVFNTRGELVRTITNQWYPQGMHTVSWDGRTQAGGHASSGIYYIRAKSGDASSVIKAVMAK